MNTKKILIIEDENDIRKNLETILTESGYVTITAVDGITGIALADSEKPNLIICELTIPFLGGYWVFNELAKKRNTDSIPFIFLTAKTKREDVRVGIQIGLVEYLHKPFKIDEVLNAVERRLKRIEPRIAKEIIENPNPPKPKYSENNKLFIKAKDSPQFFVIKEIVYISAENQYTKINLRDLNSFLVRKSISYWEEVLPEQFIRIHRSTIINGDCITKFENWIKSTFRITLKYVNKSFIVSKRYSTLIRKNKLR